MIPNILTITDGVAVGTNLVLRRMSEQNGESIYRGEYAGGSGALRTVRMSVKHTVPVDPKKPSSHLVKLDITRFTVDGEVEKDFSAHSVFRSSTGPVASSTIGHINMLTNVLAHLPFQEEFAAGAF